MHDDNKPEGMSQIEALLSANMKDAATDRKMEPVEEGGGEARGGGGGDAVDLWRRGGLGLAGAGRIHRYSDYGVQGVCGCRRGKGWMQSPKTQAATRVALGATHKQHWKALAGSMLASRISHEATALYLVHKEACMLPKRARHVASDLGCNGKL